MQVTQQVFVAKEWVRYACNEAKAEAHSYADVKKSLEALKQEQAKLSEKLVATNRDRLSAEASLKTIEKQVEE